MPAKFFSSKLLAIAAAAGTLTMASAPAFAADQSVEVRYGDLDLSSEAGVSALKQRVAVAVRHVCGNADIRNLREVADMNRCRAEAATRSDNDVQLALQNARNGTRLASNESLTIVK